MPRAGKFQLIGSKEVLGKEPGTNCARMYVFTSHRNFLKFSLTINVKFETYITMSSGRLLFLSFLAKLPRTGELLI